MPNIHYYIFVFLLYFPNNTVFLAVIIYFYFQYNIVFFFYNIHIYIKIRKNSLKISLHIKYLEEKKSILYYNMENTNDINNPIQSQVEPEIKKKNDSSPKRWSKTIL